MLEERIGSKQSPDCCLRGIKRILGCHAWDCVHTDSLPDVYQRPTRHDQLQDKEQGFDREARWFICGDYHGFIMQHNAFLNAAKKAFKDGVLGNARFKLETKE